VSGIKSPRGDGTAARVCQDRGDGSAVDLDQCFPRRSDVGAALPRPENRGKPIVLADLFDARQSPTVEGMGFGIGKIGGMGPTNDDQQPRVEYFLSALDQLASVSRVAQDRLERKLAENFSVIDVMIRSQTGEKQLSAILGFLLNPVASHGQGTAFLDNFLKSTSTLSKIHDSRNCEVIPEYYIPENGRFIDILVRFFSPRFALGIENKPWFVDPDRPSDLNNQVSDYCKHLKDRYPGAWLFVYLSGAGLAPPGHSIPIDVWREHENHRFAARMSYQKVADSQANSLAEWLENCIEVCEAESITRFLQDLLGFVRRMQGSGRKPMTIPEQEIASFILGDANRFAIAQDLSRVMGEVPRILVGAFLHRLAECIRSELTDAKWIVEAARADDAALMNKAEQGPEHGLIGIRHSDWPDTVFVGLESTYADCQEIRAGLWTDPERRQLTAQQWTALQEALRSDPYTLSPREQTATEWWPVQARLEDRGFFKDFAGPNFFELARQLYRGETPREDDVTRLAAWLASIAHKANDVLQPVSVIWTPG
jgi:PD-(D/E)XK nuclease superfamily